jgi:hypothetical protein
MLDRLRAAGTHVVEYDGGTLDRKLAAAFEPLGLTVLGPNERHLELAAERLGAHVKALRAALAPRAGLVAESVADPVDLYRALTGGGRGIESLRANAPEAVIEAARRSGAVVNAQSIVMALGDRDGRVLLTGDMQFAEPGFGGDLADEVTDLWERVKKAGPYAFTKLAHHGSHNGSPADMAAALGCSTFGLCTGADSGDHPSCEVIDALAKGRGNRWVRTDRNGQSEVTVGAGGVTVDVARGSLNDPQCH